MVEDEFSLDALTTTLNNKSLYADRTLFLTEVGNPCIFNYELSVDRDVNRMTDPNEVLSYLSVEDQIGK